MTQNQLEAVLAREQSKRMIALIVMQLVAFGCMLYEPKAAVSILVILAVGLIFGAIQEALVG